MEAEELLDESGLTERNKVFCREYIYDWNGSRSYKVAYPDITDETARVNASRLLTDANIKAYIELIQKDLEKLAGISRLKVINEHLKIAYSSIAHLHNTWIERKEFESLTSDQKDCIEEISTKIARKVQWEFNADTEKKEPIDYEVEYVKVKLYDKQKSLEAINKMLGYDAPSKIDLNLPVSLPDIIIQ
ncbi:MAG TPA: terminase small subunit [Bacteroidales bacterium]|nr:terminase small subunit [Bacteroidales bacterium]